MSTTNYVVGFMFSKGLENVAVIKKSRPAWQAGKFNGIGGKNWENEAPMDAMSREFQEETGRLTCPLDWNNVADMVGHQKDDGDFAVSVFCMVSDSLEELVAPDDEEEKIHVVPINSISLRDSRFLENVPWLIGLSLDSLEDERPSFAQILYK